MPLLSIKNIEDVYFTCNLINYSTYYAALFLPLNLNFIYYLPNNDYKTTLPVIISISLNISSSFLSFKLPIFLSTIYSIIFLLSLKTSK